MRRTLVIFLVTLFASRIISIWGFYSIRTSLTRRWCISMTSTQNDIHVELDHIEFADGDDDIPVILLHGLLGNKKNFGSVATSLHQQLNKKRKIIGIDLRNHGENHHDWRDDMSYRTMANDVLAFLDRMKIDRAVLVGHSMGGKVAKTVSLMYPERIEGLVVIDIAPVRYSSSEDMQWKAVEEIIQALKRTKVGPSVSKKEVDEQLRQYVQDPALRAFCLTNYDATLGSWKVNIETIAEKLHVIADFEIEEGMFDGDVFFIGGGQSRFIRHAHMDTIGRFFPNHMLTTVRGAGHWVHAEAPDDTVALLKKYLDR